MGLWGIVLAAALLTPLVGGAQEAPLLGLMNGNQLYNLCISNDAADSAVCLAYVMGAADEFVVADGAVHQSTSPAWACIPRQATAQQLKDTVVGYMSAHPSDRHGRAAAQVAIALAEAYPCTRDQTK